MKQLNRFYLDTAVASSPTSLPSLFAFADTSHITFGSDLSLCQCCAREPSPPCLTPTLWTRRCAVWPAPGSEDTELGVLMELEVGHGETAVHARVQA
jgi:hypothetical protein